MSATDNRPSTEPGNEDPPTFELSYRFDDLQNPTEVTVFPGDSDESNTEQWITIENGYALPIEEVR